MWILVHYTFEQIILISLMLFLKYKDFIVNAQLVFIKKNNFQICLCYPFILYYFITLVLKTYCCYYLRLITLNAYCKWPQYFREANKSKYTNNQVSMAISGFFFFFFLPYLDYFSGLRCLNLRWRNLVN